MSNSLFHSKKLFFCGESNGWKEKFCDDNNGLMYRKTDSPRRVVKMLHKTRGKEDVLGGSEDRRHLEDLKITWKVLKRLAKETARSLALLAGKGLCAQCFFFFLIQMMVKIVRNYGNKVEKNNFCYKITLKHLQSIKLHETLLSHRANIQHNSV